MFVHCFAPLLQDVQRLRKGFRLELTFHTDWLQTFIGEHAWRSSIWAMVARSLMAALAAFMPIKEALEKKCSSNVAIKLSLEDVQDTLVEEKHMDLTESVWESVVEMLAG